MNTNTIPDIPRIVNFDNYDQFKQAVKDWEQSFIHVVDNLRYSVSIPEYNKDRGQWAATIVVIKVDGQGQQHVHSMIKSAALWADTHQAYAAGWRAVQHLKQHDLFPDMTKEW